MATKSFIDTYVIERKDVNRFQNIMKNNNRVKIKEDIRHEDIRGNAMLKMLGIRNDSKN